MDSYVVIGFIFVLFSAVALAFWCVKRLAETNEVLQKELESMARQLAIVRMGQRSERHEMAAIRELGRASNPAEAVAAANRVEPKDDGDLLPQSSSVIMRGKFGA